MAWDNRTHGPTIRGGPGRRRPDHGSQDDPKRDIPTTTNSPADLAAGSTQGGLKTIFVSVPFGGPSADDALLCVTRLDGDFGQPHDEIALGARSSSRAFGGLARTRDRDTE
jgi:hypothetical protein